LGGLGDAVTWEYWFFFSTGKPSPSFCHTCVGRKPKSWNLYVRPNFLCLQELLMTARSSLGSSPWYQLEDEVFLLSRTLNAIVLSKICKGKECLKGCRELCRSCWKDKCDWKVHMQESNPVFVPGHTLDWKPWTEVLFDRRLQNRNISRFLTSNSEHTCKLDFIRASRARVFWAW
jgi:hypothetical protein